ncbi:hypothetical protein BPLS_P6322 [Bathymodiolus platifrons methanotrophic gill symbiont]|uniref:hypothetical protein n=1 Tax=Bathymodiolus platifrons methanotrophic gill symbiont TaxID=113268 RepID=UPI001B756A63|nr:hypothetical protein [Bathymodiolus platifrons methanotrophic gill symbiont]GFO77713.1 hypothetical protein BPLS_P6322 [Bathymodiolus platifrons methanotrophic gill symbiont]
MDVETEKLTTILDKLNIATKHVGTNEFKVKINDSHSAIDQFSAMVDKVIFDPIKSGKSIYDISIVDFKEYDLVKTDYEIINSEDYKAGKLPYLLTFNIFLKDNYFESVKEFLALCES